MIVSGDFKNEFKWRWLDFLPLPKTVDVSDFRCVTSWSRYDCRWAGVGLKDMISIATVTVQLTSLCPKDNVLIAYELDDKPFPLEHGGPVRLVVLDLYAYKSAERIRKIEFKKF